VTEQPDKPLDFVETISFSDTWKEFGLSDEDLRGLQNAIMRSPRGFPVIPGTGGLRKIRFAPSAWHQGKRGSLRIGYVHFAEYELVFLVLAFAKTVRGDISTAQKKVIRAMIQNQERVLARNRMIGGEF
jgi:hypothetical protein